MQTRRATRDLRRGRWDRLSQLLDSLEIDGAKRMKPSQVRELTSMYRAVSSDLLEEIRRDPESKTTEYLRALVGRGHGLLHAGSPPRLRGVIASFFVHDFPATVRKRIRAIVFATLMMVFGSVVGALAYTADPGTGEVLLPFGHRYMDASERVAEDTSKSAGAQFKEVSVQSPLFAAQLFTNNTKVTYFAFALCVTGGIGTMLLVFANGAYLGAVAAKYILDGEGVFLIAWIGPHGVVELPAILLGAGAGLVVAGALFFPGTVTRRTALHEAGRDALVLLLGATATLVVAAVVEGTISQMHEPTLPYGVKIVFAMMLGGAYAYYLLGWNRETLSGLRSAAKRGLERVSRRTS